MDRRVAVLGIADRRAENLVERHRPVIAQQPHQRAEGRGNCGGQQPGAGYQIEAELLTKPFDRRRSWRYTLTADHLAATVRLAPHQDRRLAERAVEMRFDHLQHKAGYRSRVERGAA